MLVKEMPEKNRKKRHIRNLLQNSRLWDILEGRQE